MCNETNPFCIFVIGLGFSTHFRVARREAAALYFKEDMHKRILTLLALCSLIICSCDKINDEPTPSPEKPTPEKPTPEKPTPDKPSTGDGLSYIWDFDVIPEITISLTPEEWQRLLTTYDKDNKTKAYFHCDVTYKKGDDVWNITNAGVRLRGNTSRRRPESGTHQTEGADWHHCHFGLNLRKFEKDKDHEINGIRKMTLKWFNNDPTYIREPFCFDLFNRAGIWTASRICYARVWIHIQGDTKPAYFGIYSLIEPYDNKYIARKKEQFGSTDGNLWKCNYTANGPADLRSTNANFGEDDNIHEYTYSLQETVGTFEDAKAQLQDFIAKLNGKSDESFKKWISEVCDVELLMRTYAVNVAVGMWDDMWNNGNNYYLYFNSLDKLNYKVFFIPYDYDNTLGTSNCYDPAKQNPTQWGGMGKLMERLIRIPEFKQIYVDELKRLVAPGNGLMDYDSATNRIKDWQKRISDFVPNDTGEDMSIKDEAASWSNCHYRLLGTSNNYFIEKAKTINSL